jgi:hypothetical protein
MSVAGLRCRHPSPKIYPPTQVGSPVSIKQRPNLSPVKRTEMTLQSMRTLSQKFPPNSFLRSLLDPGVSNVNTKLATLRLQTSFPSAGPPKLPSTAPPRICYHGRRQQQPPISSKLNVDISVQSGLTTLLTSFPNAGPLKLSSTYPPRIHLGSRRQPPTALDISFQRRHNTPVTPQRNVRGSMCQLLLTPTASIKQSLSLFSMESSRRINYVFQPLLSSPASIKQSFSLFSMESSRRINYTKTCKPGLNTVITKYLCNSTIVLVAVPASIPHRKQPTKLHVATMMLSQLRTFLTPLMKLHVSAPKPIMIHCYIQRAISVSAPFPKKVLCL